MRRVLIVVLAASFVLFFTSTALAATPSVIDPATGRSMWSYKDLADAAAKYEGGYAAFSNTQFAGDYDYPHGGYDTATNKCKVCHAVHRAEGAYYLLRADSQDDACDYCHIGGSAHSSRVVYDLNSAGKATPVGHTIGASTFIPGSTTQQWTEAVTLETVDADGDPVTEVLQVRAYASERNDMYRFARHHGHSPATGAARRNYVPIGPLALRCMSCHQVHNADAMTWQAVSVAYMGNDGSYLPGSHDAAGNPIKASYKLLKQFPSGTFVGGLDSYGQVPVGNISIVPETTLTAGVNFDDVRAMGAEPGPLDFQRDYNDDGDYLDAGETVSMNRPIWVAQHYSEEHELTEPGVETHVPAAVNNLSLDVWCADCHNTHNGGWVKLQNPELGFKAHPERNHPSPYTGAHSGPGQCYSCHRDDLPRINGYDPVTGLAVAGGDVDTCSQCHYGTGNYRENRYDPSDPEYVASDFPHSSEDGTYKQLGSYSILRVDADGDGDVDPTTNTVIDESVVVDKDNLDAVCLRCHGGVGTFH